MMMRWSLVVVLGLCAVFPLGCVAPGGVYEDYYEPYGYGVGYGGWGTDYYVAPFYRDHPRFHGGRGPHPGFRAAPPSHSIPSIPSRGRPGGAGGGGRGGGRGGGGGGHGR